MPTDETAGGANEAPAFAGVEDVHLQTVDTLPAVCTDVLIELHRGFGRIVRTNLSEYLESDLTVTAPVIRQLSYAEYLHSLNPPVFAGVASCDFLSGPLIATSDHSLASALIDRLLGGPGQPVTDRWPTDVDTAIFWGLLERMLACLQVAFRPLAETEIALSRLELSPHFLSVAAHEEPVAVFDFTLIQGEDPLGSLTLCYPFASLTPLIERLPTPTAPPPGEEPVTEAALGPELEDVEVTLDLALNPTRIPIAEFLTLQPGDVVLLDHWADEPAIGYVSQHPVLGLQLGQMQGHLAGAVTDWRES